MKITDRRCGWTASGSLMARIPAMVMVNQAEMLSYYGLVPDDKKYHDLARASRFERVVLKKPDGEFLIVPINPDVYMLET